MEAKAVGRFIRVAPRKARLVADAIRGKHVSDALAILRFTPNFAARYIEKIVKSAIANAENNYHMDGEALKVSKAFVDQGPSMKRLRAAPMGRAHRILKRTSHITVVLEEAEVPAQRRARRKEVAKVAKAAPRKAGAAKAEGKAAVEEKGKAPAKRAAKKPKSEPEAAE